MSINWKKLMIQALAVSASCALAVDAAGCAIESSIAQRVEAGSFRSNGKINYIYDITVKNTGTCGATLIGINPNYHSEECEVTQQWNLEAGDRYLIVTGYGGVLQGGASYNGAGQIISCNATQTTAPTADVTVYGANCEASCDSTTGGATSAPTSAPTSTPTPTPTPTPTSAPEECPAAAQTFIAIEFSSYNGTYGTAAASGGAQSADAYAKQGCTGVSPAEYAQSYGCAPILIAQNTCGAIAVSTKTSTPYPVNNYQAGVATGATKTEAESAALANCNCLITSLPGVTCSVKASICSSA